MLMWVGMGAELTAAISSQYRTLFTIRKSRRPSSWLAVVVARTVCCGGPGARDGANTEGAAAAVGHGDVVAGFDAQAVGAP